MSGSGSAMLGIAVSGIRFRIWQSLRPKLQTPWPKLHKSPKTVQPRPQTLIPKPLKEKGAEFIDYDCPGLGGNPSVLALWSIKHFWGGLES